MPKKPSYEDMEALVADLGKEARKGGKKDQKKGSPPAAKRGLLSRFRQSEATRQVKELEIQAIERKYKEERKRVQEQEKDVQRLRKTQEAVHEILAEFLKAKKP
ncbi:MAG: hypothetical protein JW821_06495 [Deltaproteobacteria bacterium]|nr:hypothetical protein [Deltaproteobacteria bacterium]